MKRKHIILLPLCLVYYLLLQFVFSVFIVDIYGYAGFVDNFNKTKMALGLLFVSLPFALIKETEFPSCFFNKIIWWLILVPSVVIFVGSDLAFNFIFLVMAAVIAVQMSSQFLKIPMLRTSYVDGGKMGLFLSLASLLYIFLVLYSWGGKYLNFSISRVYEFRELAAESLPGIFGYLMPIFSKAIIPFGLVISILCKHRIAIIIFIFCSIMVFSITSHKGPLFYPFIIIGLVYFFKFKHADTFTLLALILIVFLGGVDFYLMQQGFSDVSGWLGSLFVRRGVIVPVYLNWCYWDFFSNSQYYYWASSKISLGLLPEPYGMSMPNLIGSIFASGANANTGWIGSGMGNAGPFGVLLYSILIGFVFSIFDGFSKKIGRRFVIAVFSVPVLTMAQSTDFPTIFVTHGLVFLVLLTGFLSKRSFSSANVKNDFL